MKFHFIELYCEKIIYFLIRSETLNYFTLISLKYMGISYRKLYLFLCENNPCRNLWELLFFFYPFFLRNDKQYNRPISHAGCCNTRVLITFETMPFYLTSESKVNIIRLRKLKKIINIYIYMTYT